MACEDSCTLRPFSHTRLRAVSTACLEGGEERDEPTSRRVESKQDTRSALKGAGWKGVRAQPQASWVELAGTAYTGENPERRNHPPTYLTRIRLVLLDVRSQRSCHRRTLCHHPLRCMKGRRREDASRSTRHAACLWEVGATGCAGARSAAEEIACGHLLQGRVTTPSVNGHRAGARTIAQ